MGIQGGSVLFGLLLILAVFCHSGHSLQCYSCPNPTADCKTAVNCSSGFDACLITKAGLRVYNQCWKFEHCTFNEVTTRLKESELTYHCCKKDLCNINEQLENDTFLKALKDEKLQGLKTRQPGKKSASLS
ncbi:CD59 isoform 11 [Pongo abelii]|uniref:CD59 glycoprotein n=1 Tax=Pongo abelii TaxID=9601 RepID=A0A2J8WG23_PONAB|nr:CD59 isoform 11 [Pongo abelii]